MGKIKLLILTIGLLSVFAFAYSAFAYADTEGDGYENNTATEITNGEVLSKTNSSLTVIYPVLEKVAADGTEKWVMKTVNVPASLLSAYGGVKSFNAGDKISFNLKDDGTVTRVNGAEWTEANASGFVVKEGSIWDTKYVYNRLFKTYCRADQAIACWTGRVFQWSQGAILLLSTAVMVGGGILYMTSAGDPKRIALAKKYMYGAVYGVAIIVLAKFFLTRVIGVPWL